MYTNLRDFMPKRRRELSPELATAADTVNAEAREQWGNPLWHREQAAIIGEAIDLGFNNGLSGVFDSVLQTETLGFSDVKRIKLRYGLEVFSVAEGGYVDETTLRTDHFTMGRDSFGWHIVATEQDAISDWAETMGEITRLARVKEQMEVLRRQYALLDAAIPVSSPYAVDGTGGLTKTLLDGAIDEVFDAYRYEGPLSANSSIQIIGRATAVGAVTDLDGYTPTETAVEEVRALGYLGRYRGALVRRLSNWADEDGNSFFPEDELWVVSPGAGKFVFYGGTRPNSWVEQALRKVHTDTRRTVGGLVYQPQVVRRIFL